MRVRLISHGVVRVVICDRQFPHSIAQSQDWTIPNINHDQETHIVEFNMNKYLQCTITYNSAMLRKKSQTRLYFEAVMGFSPR